ncbi:arabinan endo-1,5-alpha-L-arabinosidase [Caldalkalibacillus salinus]|uniref:arabinan endo-1,5-alpha-L-arabinosidase n=1 Tax=Caldalkalibacillus salinus TaxID=2803787 RepID=UPI0019229C1A|nr:arabinan endo-1,5-alpha-L-arabinosidase [Caldalkalibacillus salinus]
MSKRSGFNSLSIGIIVALAIGISLSTMALANDNSHSENKGKGQPPEGKLNMYGDTGDYVPNEVDDPVHDPALIRDGDTYYVFSTGLLRNPEDPGGIYVRKSEGTLEGPWEALGEIPAPEWVLDYEPNHLWAPQVVRNGDKFYLYYAASSFGTNQSAIGVASTATPGDLDSWVDHGPVLTSEGEDYNAIDPHVFSAEGDWWMVFGSHFSGIKLQKMDGMTNTTGDIYTLANRPGVPHNPVEAPTIIKKGQYYYLFTSWDRCCAGLDSTYKIAVGRSESVTGPYVDQNGVPLEIGGGTIVLQSEGNQVGPGGQDILQTYGKDYLIHHYYDGEANGIIRMQIRTLGWENHWPVVEE